MRLFAISLLAASTLFSQDAKTTAPTGQIGSGETSKPAPTAKEFSEPASDSLNRSMAEMLLLEEQFHIKEYQAKAKVIRDKYEARILAECAAVGIAAKTFAELKGRCEANPDASKEYPLGVLMWVPEPKEKK